MSTDLKIGDWVFLIFKNTKKPTTIHQMMRRIAHITEIVPTRSQNRSIIHSENIKKFSDSRGERYVQLIDKKKALEIKEFFDSRQSIFHIDCAVIPPKNHWHSKDPDAVDQITIDCQLSICEVDIVIRQYRLKRGYGYYYADSLNPVQNSNDILKDFLYD